MGFHEARFPVNISYGARGGPGYNTLRIEKQSGISDKIQRWALPRHQYDISFGIRSYDDAYAVKRFFMAHGGGANGFRYKDWADYASTADGRTQVLAVSHQDQTIATANGTLTTFQLTKTYTDNGQSVIRPIKKPVSGTTVVAFGAVQQTTGWTVDTTTGIITFTVAPTNGTIIKAGFEFDVPVEMSDETDKWLEQVLEDFGSSSVPSIFLIEAVDSTSYDEGFYYGGASDQGVVAANTNIKFANGRCQAFQVNTASLKLFLPDLTGIPAGGPYFYINNTGSQSVSLRSIADSAIYTIASGQMVTVVVHVDSSGNKIWYAW